MSKGRDELIQKIADEWIYSTENRITRLTENLNDFKDKIQEQINKQDKEIIALIVLVALNTNIGGATPLTILLSLLGFK